jgi:hypothetical protein
MGCILELCRWQSVQFADYNQLYSLNNLDDGGATLQDTLQELRTADPSTGRPAVTVAWNPTADADEAFYNFAGGALPSWPSSDYKIERLDAGSAIAQLNGPRIGGDMVYTVAFNSGEDFDIRDPVPVFTEAETIHDGFPHGFEVMMCGPTGGRKVMIRLVLAADSSSARLVSRENIVLINARDY